MAEVMFAVRKISFKVKQVSSIHDGSDILSLKKMASSATLITYIDWLAFHCLQSLASMIA